MKGQKDIVRAIADIGRIGAVPTLLKVLCEMTGMRFAAVARATGKSWTVCAVRDELNVGVRLGGRLNLLGMFGLESRMARAPVVIDRAGARHHPPPANASSTHASPALESFRSVPITLGKRQFGILCALGSSCAKLAEPRFLSMFEQFASLIAAELEHHSVREQEQTALFDERATGELREQFIAILGHDLRNPLQAVCASGELLERKLADPALRLLATRIKTNVDRMSSLIDDVLDFARGRLGGGIGLEVADVEFINKGLTTVIQELLDAQPDARITSDIDVRRSVRCDLGRLQQVASNLLANALTHGRPGTPVRISARSDQRDLVLTVWNAGKPIPSESLAKIFEPFWQHSGSASRNGLGLGLHICAQIVRAHAGQISVTSTKNGTQFTVRLPLGTIRSDQPSIDMAEHRVARRSPPISLEIPG